MESMPEPIAKIFGEVAVASNDQIQPLTERLTQCLGSFVRRPKRNKEGNMADIRETIYK